MNLRFKVLLVILFSIFSQNIGQTTKLDMLIKEAIKVNPNIKSLINKKDIAKTIVPQVSNLPDPVVTIGLNNMPVSSFSFSEEPMTGKIVGLSQAVPFPGKLATAGKVKEKDAEIVDEEILDYQNSIAKEVSNLYYELIYTREAIRIAKKSKDLLNDIANVIRTKYAVSSANQQNLIKIDLEITGINDELEDLKGKEHANLSKLNALLLRVENSPIETDSLGSIKHKILTVNDLIDLSKSNRPLLKSILISKNQSKLMEDLAEYEFLPNFTFKVQYTQRGELAKTGVQLNDFLSLFVGLSIPLNYGGKKSAKVDEAKLRQKFFANKYESALQSLSKSFGEEISKLNSLYEREKLVLEGLIPQAKQSLKAAIASYRVGELDFYNVIDAQDKLYKIEKMLYRIRANYYKELAKVEFLTGTKLKLN